MKTVEEMLVFLTKVCSKIAMEFDDLGVWIVTTWGGKGKCIVADKQLKEAVEKTYKKWQ